MSDYSHPLPELDDELTRSFYDHCKQGALHFQRCTACSSWRHVPREMCAECGSWDWEWSPSTGRGKIFSWTVVGRALHPAFQDDTPYAPVIVEMDEGVRLLTQITDVAPDALEIDMPVEIAFDAVTPEITLPKFKRASA
jgi:hypothetical protein